MLRLLVKNNCLRLLFISSFALVACSSSPLSIQLHPNIELNPPPLFASDTAWQINSQDQRIAQYLIEISRGENAATLINEAQSSHLMIKEALQQQWQKQGLKFNTASHKKIDIQLIKLLSKVQQKRLTYDITAAIIIKIKLTAENKIFSKTFTSHFSKEGPFTANTSKVSEQLSIQLSQLLNEIIKDAELSAKLQQLESIKE